MATHEYNERVSISLAPSRLARAFVALGAAATLFLVWALPLEPWPRLGAALWAGALSLCAARRLRAGCALSVDARGDVASGSRAGTSRAGSFVAPWLTVLRWRPAGACFDHALLVMPDALDAESFRRLRVLLRLTEPGTHRGRSRDAA